MARVGEERQVRAAACYDCGGRCPYVLHVRGDKVVRLEPHHDLRPCVRVYAMAKDLHSPDRLKHPLRRTGKRGEGKFERISWDEAFRAIASELERVKLSYGPQSILFMYGAGTAGGYAHHPDAMMRVINKFGGCTTVWGGASGESSVFASRVTYGTLEAQHTRNDLVNSRLIILWGQNPAVTIQGTDTAYWIVKAKEAGARIVVVDPRFTPSAGTWADSWLPVRVGSDTALALAMAHTIITRGLQNQAFVDRYTVGFDQFRDYVLGKADGIAKTSRWASPITGASPEAIEQLAVDYGTIRPAALMPSFAPGRTRHGAQYHRAVSVLAAITGNIGINGGSPAGFDRPLVVGQKGPVLPTGKNPVEVGAPSLRGSLEIAKRNAFRVHQAKAWDAIVRGKAGGYPADFKLGYIIASNRLNQFPNLPKGIEALDKLEFVVVHEQYMNATAKFADILLPVSSHWERDDLYRPWVQGSYYVFSNQAVEPLYEHKSDFEIARDLAPYLGIDDFGDADPDQWIRQMVVSYAEDRRFISDYDGLKRDGQLCVVHDEPVVAFREQVLEPERHPFATPSGKIEIYSTALAALGDPDYPPLPTFFPDDQPAEQAKRYPLRLMTTHSLVRAHSNFHLVSWLRELHPQALLISATDAAARGIQDGDDVLAYNDLGKVRLPAAVTERLMPGIVDIPEGAWYEPDDLGIDRGGCPNTLTPDAYAPGGGYEYNGIPVEVRRIVQ